VGRSQGDAVTLQLVGDTGVVLEIRRRRGYITARFRQRLATVERLDDRQPLGVPADQLGGAVENTAAFYGQGVAPRTPQRTSRIVHRGVNIGDGCRRNVGKDLTRGRIDGLDPVPAYGVDLAAADIHMPRQIRRDRDTRNLSEQVAAHGQTSQPPSTAICWPVIWRASSEARNRTALAISWPSVTRFSAMSCTYSS